MIAAAPRVRISMVVSVTSKKCDLIFLNAIVLNGFIHYFKLFSQQIIRLINS